MHPKNSKNTAAKRKSKHLYNTIIQIHLLKGVSGGIFKKLCCFDDVAAPEKKEFPTSNPLYTRTKGSYSDLTYHMSTKFLKGGLPFNNGN